MEFETLANLLDLTSLPSNTYIRIVMAYLLFPIITRPNKSSREEGKKKDFFKKKQSISKIYYI